MSTFDTQLFYIFVFLLTTICIDAYQRRNYSKSKLTVSSLLFGASFLVHCVFLVFSDIGADYQSYLSLINLVTKSNLFSFDEFLFYLVAFVVKNLSGRAEVAIAFIKVITTLFFYYGFFKIRTKVNLTYSIIAYNTFLCLQGFNLISMNFAISVLFVSMIDLTENKNGLAFILLIISCFIHSSCFMFIPLYGAFLVVNKGVISRRNRKITRVLSMLFMVVALVVVATYATLYEYLTTVIPYFRQYRQYGLLGSYSGSGIMQYVFYLWVLYFVVLVYWNSSDNRFVTFSVIFSIASFAFSLLGYKLAVLSRVNKSFFILYSFCIPSIFQIRVRQQRENKKGKYIFECRVDKLIWGAFLLIQFVLMFISMTGQNAVSGVENYRFNNPFVGY